MVRQNCYKKSRQRPLCAKLCGHCRTCSASHCSCAVSFSSCAGHFVWPCRRNWSSRRLVCVFQSWQFQFLTCQHAHCMDVPDAVRPVAATGLVRHPAAAVPTPIRSRLQNWHRAQVQSLAFKALTFTCCRSPEHRNCKRRGKMLTRQSPLDVGRNKVPSAMRMGR